MNLIIERSRHITRAHLRLHPGKTFLFGDNLMRVGYGGQAREMRGEPNAVGIPTKKRPTSDPGAFFSDLEFERNKAAIDRAFDRLAGLAPGSIVVIPAAGLGTGRADLAARAPRTFLYLCGRLAELSRSR